MRQHLAGLPDRSCLLGRLAALVVGLLAVCADAWAAAGVYEELSRLSDAELDRRGVHRDALNRRVFEIVTRRT